MRRSSLLDKKGAGSGNTESESRSLSPAMSIFHGVSYFPDKSESEDFLMCRGRLIFLDGARLAYIPSNDSEREKERLSAAFSRATADFLAESGAGEDQKTCSLILADEDFRGLALTLIDGGDNARSAIIEAGKYFGSKLEKSGSEYTEIGRDCVKLCESLVFGELMKEYGGICGKSDSGIIESTEDIIIVAENNDNDNSDVKKITSLLGKRLQGMIFRSDEVPESVATGVKCPILYGVGEIDASLSGKDAVIDFKSGRVFVSPDGDLLKRYRKYVGRRERDRILRSSLIGVPSETSDGRMVRLDAQINNTGEIISAIENDCDGIGLFSTRFLFEGRDEPPSESEQREVYSAVSKSLGGRRAAIMGLDADNTDPAYPFLSKFVRDDCEDRGKSALLTIPSILHTQMRAVILSGCGAFIMPGMNTPGDVIRASRVFRSVVGELEYESGEKITDAELGVMIESPAAALMSEDIAELCDFFVIGSDALIISTVAGKRGDRDARAFYSSAKEPVMMLISRTVESIHKSALRHGKNKRVSVSGIIASDREMTEALIDSGIDGFILPPQKILTIREAVRKI